MRPPNSIPSRSDPVVSAQVALRAVVEVDAARLVAGAFLGADDGLVGTARMPLLGGEAAFFQVAEIIQAGNFDNLREAAAPTTADGDRDRSRRINLLHPTLHRGADARAGIITFNGPFLVADGPEDNARVIAVAQHHAFEMVVVVLRRAHQPVLVNHDHTEAIAGVEQLGRGRIV